MATKTSTDTTSTGIIVFAFELIVVGIITLLAGINDAMGKAMVIVMITFWLIYMITNSAVVSTFGGFVANLTGNSNYTPQGFNNFVNEGATP